MIPWLKQLAELQDFSHLQTTWQGKNSRQRKKCPTDFFPYFQCLTEDIFEKQRACPNLISISSISVPAGQHRHACGAFQRGKYAKYVHATLKFTDQLILPIYINDIQIQHIDYTSSCFSPYAVIVQPFFMAHPGTTEDKD